MPADSLQILVDANVFIAAVKGGWTKSTELLIHLLNRSDIQLIADRVLILEYKIYAKELRAPHLLGYLLPRISIIKPSKEQIAKCQQYLPVSETADALHAAACLAAKGILISNDKDFEAIRREGIITIWTISEAIQHLL